MLPELQIIVLHSFESLHFHTVPDSQEKVREVSSANTMATACRLVSRGNRVMFFTLLISVT